jgi:AbrB family looped-hinge helix DNA binding protein
VAKVTSKLQVTIPKAIADRYGIVPGDELDWVPSEGAVWVVPVKALVGPFGAAERVALFDAATERQRQREQQEGRAKSSAGRGWTRAELYERGSSG